MTKKVVLDNVEYEIIKDYNDAYDQEIVSEKYTDYFYDYDYILGDYSYGKLRLKGFYDNNNKKVKSINNYKDIDKYLKVKCAYGCKHFILSKPKQESSK